MRRDDASLEVLTGTVHTGHIIDAATVRKRFRRGAWLSCSQLDQFDSLTQYAIVDFDIALRGGDVAVTSEFGQHADIDALVGKRSDEGASATM